MVKHNNKINDAKSMSTEIEIMKRIRHRHIVSMHELFETPSCLWMILELVNGGDLRNFLGKAEHYTEAIAARHFKQILRGVHYLHSNGVVHRDLKLQNVLLTAGTSSCDLKIADFGLSALVRINDNGYDAEESGKRKEYNHLNEMWGTREYFAPEVIDRAYGPQADVWALGCILYEIFSGTAAFPISDYNDKNARAEQHRQIKIGKFVRMEGEAWDAVSSEAKDLVLKLLVVDPTVRYSATEALMHPWITGEGHTEKHHIHLKASISSHYRRRQERKAKKLDASRAAASQDSAL